MSEYISKISLPWEFLYILMPHFQTTTTKTKSKQTTPSKKTSLYNYLARRSLLNDIFCLQPDRREDMQCKHYESSLQHSFLWLYSFSPAAWLHEMQRTREQSLCLQNQPFHQRKITQRNDSPARNEARIKWLLIRANI